MATENQTGVLTQLVEQHPELPELIATTRIHGFQEPESLGGLIEFVRHEGVARHVQDRLLDQLEGISIPYEVNPLIMKAGIYHLKDEMLRSFRERFAATAKDIDYGIEDAVDRIMHEDRTNACDGKILEKGRLSRFDHIITEAAENYLANTRLQSEKPRLNPMLMRLTAATGLGMGVNFAHQGNAQYNQGIWAGIMAYAVIEMGQHVLGWYFFGKGERAYLKAKEQAASLERGYRNLLDDQAQTKREVAPLLTKPTIITAA
jgi:hypothetical protein